jgi:hypothetical protein
LCSWFLFLFNNASISLLESYRPVSHLNSLFVITSTKILMPKSCVMLLRCVLSSEMLSKWGTSVLMHHVPNMHLITYFNKPISGLVRFISWLVHFSSICLPLWVYVFKPKKKGKHSFSNWMAILNCIHHFANINQFALYTSLQTLTILEGVNSNNYCFL